MTTPTIPASEPKHATEFFFRRLADPPELFGYPLDFDPMWWLLFAGLAFIGIVAWVVWMYSRDAKAVGGWAVFLAAVRLLACACFIVVWLLPALREVEYTEQHSRVLVLFDVSSSVTEHSDDPPSDSPGQIRRTRAEVLFERISPDYTPLTTSELNEEIKKADYRGLTEEEALKKARQRYHLIEGLAANNPTFCYRFGERLDVTPWVVTDRQPVSAREWLHKLQPAGRPTVADPVPLDIVLEYDKAAKLLAQLREQENLEGPARERRQRDILENLEKALAEQQQVNERLLNRTNLGAAMLDLLRKESGNLVQALVIVSDGRNNAGASQDITEAINLAKKSKIPIFTVGIGQHRETLNLRLADVLAPGRTQPEDEWPARVVVEGENLPKGQEVNVTLTIQTEGLQKQELTQRVALAETTSRLSSGAAEFRVDLAKLFQLNPKNDVDRERLIGAWQVRARVEPIKGERTRSDNVTEEPATVRGEDRKLSVLLATSGSGRDFTFLRTLLVREKEKFDLTIYHQGALPGTILDVEPNRLLDQFPSALRDRDADPKNLGNYDVVIAFDLDWRRVPVETQQLLSKWVTDFAGGLVVVAGQIHTFNLARDKESAPVRALLPVVLDDTVGSIWFIDRPSKEPWALNWDPAAQTMPFLDITDVGDKAKVLEGWEEFFEVVRTPMTGYADIPARRGFYSFFPIKDVKGSATILARFSDPDNRFTMQHGPRRGERQPYMVIHTAGKGPVFYLGSAETWRLREHSEKAHERFWTKLIRHMGKGDQTRGSRRGLLVVGSRYVEGDTVEVEAQIYDAEMKPFIPEQGVKILLTVTPPEGTADAPKEWTEGLEMRPVSGRPGWFAARFPVKRAGKYTVEVKIPGSIEKLASGFRVERTDPERDLTRPDYALLHRIASEVRSLDEAKRKLPGLMDTLARNRQAVKAQAKDAPPGSIVLTEENEVDRLFFQLDDMHMIGWCVDPNVVPFRTEGKVIDLWDKGWSVFWHWDDPERAAPPPAETWAELFYADNLWAMLTGGLPWVLVLVVLLLSVEWLTRKFLRLA